MLVFSPNGQKSIIGVIRPDNHAERIDCTIFTLDEYHEITKNLKLAVRRSKREDSNVKYGFSSDYAVRYYIAVLAVTPLNPNLT